MNPNDQWQPAINPLGQVKIQPVPLMATLDVREVPQDLYALWQSGGAGRFGRSCAAARFTQASVAASPITPIRISLIFPSTAGCPARTLVSAKPVALDTKNTAGSVARQFHGNLLSWSAGRTALWMSSAMALGHRDRTHRGIKPSFGVMCGTVDHKLPCVIPMTNRLVLTLAFVLPCVSAQTAHSADLAARPHS